MKPAFPASRFRAFVLSCFRDLPFSWPAWLFAALVWTAFVASSLRAEQNLSAILREVRIEQRLDGQVPGDLEFRDESGRKVRLGDYLRDRPHVLILIYFRCPKLCPLTLDGLTGSLQSLADFDVGKQFDVIAVSFDPQDTPSMAADKKESYAAVYGRPGAAAAWHFLTGPQESIDRLTKAVGFHYVYDPKLNQFIHASGIMLLTPEGRISRYLLGVKFVPRDLRLGLVEASDNKIGSPVDQVLLYCFHYDPDKGKYTASVMNFVRAGGALIVLGLGVFGWAMWRRERRKPRRSAQDPDATAPAGHQPAAGDPEPPPPRTPDTPG